MRRVLSSGVFPIKPQFMQGTHITGELFNCALDYLDQANALQALCLQHVQDAGLTAVGHLFHSFGEKQGVTGTVLLAESHMALHTWPELACVTLDVYVCNFERDNTNRAHALFDRIAQTFKPQKISQQTTTRSIPNASSGYDSPCLRVVNESVTPHYGIHFDADACLAQGQSAFQKYAIYSTPEFGRVLTLDGVCMTSERDEFFYHEAIVHIAAFTHPNPMTALVIGGGDGGCAEELLKHPSITRVDVVEIDAVVIDLAKQYLTSIHHGAFDDSRLHLHITDGFNYAQNTTQTFDLIILDLTDITLLTQSLYAEKFYQLCASRLNPNGLLCLHLGAPLHQPKRVQHHLQELSSLFKVVRPFGIHVPIYGAYWGFAICSGSLDPQELSDAYLCEEIKNRRIKQLQLYNAKMHHSMMTIPDFFMATLPL